MIVNAYHQLQGFENIYAIGDTAIQSGDANFPEGHPQVAQVAIQQGKNLARNFHELAKGKLVAPWPMGKTVSKTFCLILPEPIGFSREPMQAFAQWLLDEAKKTTTVKS